MLNKILNLTFRSDEGLISLFLIIITLATFWPVHTYEFLNFDDDRYIYENPHIKEGLTWEGIQWAFSADLVSDSPNADFWIPITFLSHMLTIELYGMDASMHHLVNLLFHLLNTLLLFVVLHRMTGGMWQSAFVATLFAVHPLHVESVAWITERKDVLSTFFWFLTMWAYLQYTIKPNLYRYLLVILAFALGLMAKPMLITLPFVLLLLDYWPLNRLPLTNWKVIGNRVWEKVPLFILVASTIAITFLALQKGDKLFSLEMFPIGTRISNALVSYVSYIGKMFWPHNLAALYPHPGNSLPLWEVAGSGLLLICLSILVFRLTPKHPYLGIGWLWYLGTLFPVSGLVQAGLHAMADRYTYVPHIGLFIMIAWGVPTIAGQWKHRKIILGISAGITIFALIIATWFQVDHWRSSITLFERAIKVTENNHIAHHNLGSAYQDQKRYDEAIQQYQRALTIKSNFGSYINLGLIFHQQGRIKDAIREYQKALILRPSFAKGHFNLANAYQKFGRFDEAIQAYQRTLALKPNFAQAHFNLGNLFQKLGRFDESIHEYYLVLNLKPDAPGIHYNLGVIYQKTGQLDEAIQEFKIALKLYPQFVKARRNLNMALKEKESEKRKVVDIFED